MKIEYLSLGVNVACLLFYTAQGSEPGKILYWLGAVILTIGLLNLRG